ncbi:MAG: NADH-quinone oxidoreductase subunit L, partial [Chloroflexi bacterium]|nr:NADH-quinone oxidoreductase subunit L [Chloroflexota bacterium]
MSADLELHYPEIAFWAIIFLPLLSFLIISLFLRPFFPQRPKLAGYVTIAAIGGSTLLSLWVLGAVNSVQGRALPLPEHPWLSIGNLSISFGLMVDGLTGIMLVVVSFVSLLIQVYSQGYMRGDPGYPRYYAFMSLFTASMLGLVLASNLILLYMFWELVGLCSYLLIGFWFQRPAAAAAAKKAFIVTRFGDFGFLLAILYTYLQTQGLPGGPSFDIAQLHAWAVAGALGGPVLTWLALGVFAGAAGKSAQFPLHTWLPDAMEGPTPVSALIHAATMVAAGVFLVARMFPLFEHSEQALRVVAYIGAITLVFAATMGVVMNDIKRVMAYSTISQLGYMMLGLGMGSVAVGMFHLFNHAFFKALLFLGAGSVNHTTGTFDMRLMGGLRRAMPWTFATLLVAGLSLAGIPPFSGFWSKDGVLALARENNILFVLALAGVFLTAFYIFRMMFLTFGGHYRGGATPEHPSISSGHGGGGHSGGHGSLHESPWVMVVPMAVLAVLSVVSGMANYPTPWMAELLGEHGEVLDLGLAAGSTLVALLGIFLAYAIYGARWLSADALGRALRPLHTLVSRKYYFDELCENFFVIRVVYSWTSGLMHWIDTYLIDDAGNLVAWVGRNIGALIARLQSGQVQA